MVITTPSQIVFECRSKACAPPPVGSGGSRGGGGRKKVSSASAAYNEVKIRAARGEKMTRGKIKEAWERNTTPGKSSAKGPGLTAKKSYPNAGKWDKPWDDGRGETHNLSVPLMTAQVRKQGRGYHATATPFGAGKERSKSVKSVEEGKAWVETQAKKYLKSRASSLRKPSKNHIDYNNVADWAES